MITYDSATDPFARALANVALRERLTLRDYQAALRRAPATAPPPRRTFTLEAPPPSRRHLRYPDADAIALRYVFLGERIHNRSRAVCLYDAAGEYCRACGSEGRATTIVRKRRADGSILSTATVCSACGRPWDGVELWVLREQARGTGGAQNRSEAALVALCDDVFAEWRILAPMVEHRPRNASLERWRFAVTAWLAYLHESIGSVANVVAYGLEERDEFPLEWWTRWIVEAEISRARTVVEQRARRRRLLRGGGGQSYRQKIA